VGCRSSTVKVKAKLEVISVFRRDIDEICPHLGYHAASSRVKNFLTFEEETDTLSRKVGKGLPQDAA
jgi:hypothetical protein